MLRKLKLKILSILTNVQMIKKKAIQFNMNFIFFFIVFITILFLGSKNIGSLLNTSEELKDSETISNLVETIKICDDPLKRGSNKIVDTTSENFNVICVLGKNFKQSSFKDINEFNQIYDSGNNFIILLAELEQKGNKYSFDYNNYKIYSSKKLDSLENIGFTGCWNDENKDRFLINISCI